MYNCYNFTLCSYSTQLHWTPLMYSEKVCSSALLTITNTPQVLVWRPRNVCSKYFPPPPTRENYSSSVSYSLIQLKTLTCFSFLPPSSSFLHPVPLLLPCLCSLLLPHPLYYITHFLPFLQPLALSPRPLAPHHAFFCTDALSLQTLDWSLLDFPFPIYSYTNLQGTISLFEVANMEIEIRWFPRGKMYEMWYKVTIWTIFLALYVAYLVYCVFFFF